MVKDLFSCSPSDLFAVAFFTSQKCCSHRSFPREHPVQRESPSRGLGSGPLRTKIVVSSTISSKTIMSIICLSLSIMPISFSCCSFQTNRNFGWDSHHPELLQFKLSLVIRVVIPATYRQCWISQDRVDGYFGDLYTKHLTELSKGFDNIAVWQFVFFKHVVVTSGIVRVGFLAKCFLFGQKQVWMRDL